MEEEKPLQDDEFLDINESPIDFDESDQSEETEFTEMIVPSEKELDSSYLNLILNPNLRELEVYIRGLENVKVYDPKQRKEIIKVRKIKNHFLNELGINAILQELKLHTSSDMTLQRFSEETFRIKTHEVGRTFHRLIFKNMKSFGMDTHAKQRNARRLWLAIKNKIDGAYSRAIGGKENDLSRATIQLHGEIDGLGGNVPYFGGQGNQRQQGRRQNRNYEDMRN